MWGATRTAFRNLRALNPDHPSLTLLGEIEARSQLLDTGNSGQRWFVLDNLSAASYAIQHRPITAVD